MIKGFYDAYTILNKVYTDGAYLSQAINSTQIEELSRRKTVKLCYGVLDKDIELSYYIKKLADKNPKLVIRTLLKLSFYMIKYMDSPPYVVTDNVVELAKKLGKGANAAFLNAVIRKFSTTEFALPKDGSDEFYSVKYSYPLFAVRELIADYGSKLAEEIMSYDEENQYARFLVNVDGAGYLTLNGIKFETTPYADLFKVRGLKINDDFNNGVFTFQSIGSRAICEAAVGGGCLLDACSAPGGKAVFLSDYYDSVICAEKHQHRALLIEAYAKRCSKENITVCVEDSSVVNEAYLDLFDTVLCDVPCSGFGTVKDNPDIKLKNGDTLSELNKLQLKILKNCSQYVKVGGSLVYSTCSVFSRENDGIVEAFLKSNGNFAVVDDNCALAYRLTRFGKLFLPQLSGGAGFYFSKLKRIK